MTDEINGEKLDELSETVGEVKTTVDEIKAILVGNTKNPEKKGMLERIRLIEKWIGQREWFEKLIIVVIVGQAIGLVFLLIKETLIK